MTLFKPRKWKTAVAGGDDDCGQNGDSYGFVCVCTCSRQFNKWQIIKEGVACESDGWLWNIKQSKKRKERNWLPTLQPDISLLISSGFKSGLLRQSIADLEQEAADCSHCSQHSGPGGFWYLNMFRGCGQTNAGLLFKDANSRVELLSGAVCIVIVQYSRFTCKLA